VLQKVLRHIGSAIHFSVNYTLAKKFLQLKHLFCCSLCFVFWCVSTAPYNLYENSL